MKDIAIYGAGGFGREVACLIKHINNVSNKWNFIGFFDDGLKVGTLNAYGKVLGNMDVLNNWKTKLSVIIAVGSPKIITSIYEKIHNDLVDFPNIIAPDVLFFDKESLILGKGNIITFGCRLSCNVKIGDFNILNGCVSLGHDVEMASYNVLFPETRISGQTSIGNLNFFGARSFASQGLKIGNNTRIGAGTILLRNTKDNFLYMGNPAKHIEI